MKNLIISCFLSFTMFSCWSETPEPPKYVLTIISAVPDSLKDKVKQCIVETMSGSSYHMTTSDYEDPEDAIRESNRSCVSLYTKKIVTLAKIVHGNGYSDFKQDHGYYNIMPLEVLNKTELLILDSLKNQ